MTYQDGQEMLLGDRINLGGDMTGILRALIEEKEFDDGFLPSEWTNLANGILVESKEAGLIHYPKDMVSRLELIARNATL